MSTTLTLLDAWQRLTADPGPSKPDTRKSPKHFTAPILAAVAVLALSVTLVITIYFTQLDIQWIAFLFGVLFAAVVALVTMTVKAQWLLAQSATQIEHQKELIAEGVKRGERSAQALKAADARFRTVLGGVATAVFFVDREERCRFANPAFEAWCGRSELEIAGRPMSDLFDQDVYGELQSHCAQALAGKETRFDARWRADEAVTVRLLPYPVGAEAASGCYAFMSPAGKALKPPAHTPEAERLEIAPAPEAEGIEIAPPPEVASEAAYLEAMELLLDPGGKAREVLLHAIEEDHFILLEQRIEPLTPEGLPNLREVLLRLQEDAERSLPPAEFFDIAERYALMPAIDRWVIRKLLRYCAAMKASDRSWRMPLYCVNVSGATLRDRGFANHVRAQLEHWDIAGSRLCLEIHHKSLEEHHPEIANLMAQLKPLGCRFTVDGFGSQKVSFAPFRELRFDHLKIDGSIVSQVLRSRSDLTKVKAIAIACGKIGVQTIAQFVEDDAMRAKLQEAGVDYVQGFGIDKPGPLAVVAA